MEASALTNASQRGFLARRSPLLKLQGDEKLIAMARSGNSGAFETIVDRYQPRLLGFCRQMLGSSEDAEDVLQEVFVNAYRAMLADEREINLRPWLYRIARNRCLNHLRKPTADAQESMDMVPVVDAASTAERVNNREEFRQLLDDVGKLPETQRTALLLREMDAMSYEEISAAMDTSVPSVKSLLVRARIALAEASQARQLTCGEVRLELAEAAEGLRKVSGPIRRHVRECEECADFRSQVRTNEKAMAALFPVGALVALKSFIASKLGFGAGSGAGAGASGAAGGATAGTSAAGAGAAGATATAGAAGAGAGAGAVGAALGGGGAAGGIGAVGALGTKAVAGVVTAAVITAGAVEVNKGADTQPPANAGGATVTKVAPSPSRTAEPRRRVAPAQAAVGPALAVAESTARAASTDGAGSAPAEPEGTPPPAAASEQDEEQKEEKPAEEADEKPEASGSNPKIEAGESPEDRPGAPRGGETVVVTVGGSGEDGDSLLDEVEETTKPSSSSGSSGEKPSKPSTPTTPPPAEEPEPEPEEPATEEEPPAEEEPAPEAGEEAGEDSSSEAGEDSSSEAGEEAAEAGDGSGEQDGASTEAEVSVEIG